MHFDWQSTFLCLFIFVFICSLCVKSEYDIIFMQFYHFPVSSPCFPFSHEENLHYHMQQVFHHDFSGLLFLVVLWFELKVPCLIGRHFFTWVTPPALWFLKHSSFIIPISVYTYEFDIHSYRLYVVPTRPHSGKNMNAQDS
jgi:hypothetical protein